MRPIIASKMDDIQKILKFITYKHLKYWKGILIHPRKSRDDIQEESIKY